ncbi:uncharacterized protein LOC141520639 isoform X2 [Macrotis lagotis]|uniref:uncharacterized protein LOC141520639 isoform X2 n=1 Tax=Macrotis lagotis TaxID=92651 RepID=UPI003D6992A4
MGRTKRTLQDAGQVQSPRKNLHPHSNKVMPPRAPSQIESFKEENPQSKSTLMPCVNHNVKNKFFPQPDQKITVKSSSSFNPQARSMLLPPVEHQEKTVSLPQIDHPIVTEASHSKLLNKTSGLPIKCFSNKDNKTSQSLAHPKKLPKVVPEAPNHQSNIQEGSVHQNEDLLYQCEKHWNLSHLNGQDNTRIYPDCKRIASPVTLFPRFETQSTSLPQPSHSLDTSSQSIMVCQKVDTFLLPYHNHQLRLSPLPCTDYGFKTKAKPLLSLNHWAKDPAVPLPSPMPGSATMIVQWAGSSDFEDPNDSCIPGQYNQPSYVPSTFLELPLQYADMVKKTSTFLLHPKQVEARQDYSPNITTLSSNPNQSAFFPLHAKQWIKLISVPYQYTETLQDSIYEAEQALNQEKYVEIAPQVKTQLNQDCKIKSPTSLRDQAESLMKPDQYVNTLQNTKKKKKVKTKIELDQQVEFQKSQGEQDKVESRHKQWGEISLVPEQQDHSLSVQNHKLKGISGHFQGTPTLLDPVNRTKAQQGYLSEIEKNSQAISPLGMHHLGKGSSDLKTQGTSLPVPDLHKKPPYAELQIATQIDHSQQEETPEIFKLLEIPHQGLNHWDKVPIGSNKYQPTKDGTEFLPDACYPANAMQKLGSSQYFHYIKPYTTEGGNIPDGIVNKIINSIPQEKIENDIQKILQEQTKRYSPWTDHRLSSNYTVCLLCSSWIPYGCSHVSGKDNPCRAQLEAIPTPIPGSNMKMGIKFVLKLPKYQTFPTFCRTLSHYDMPGRSSPLLPFLPSSCLDSTPLRSPNYYWKTPKRTWLDFIRDKEYYLHEQQMSRNQLFLGKMYELINATREEEARSSRGTYKSLLEKFQRKRRAN